MLIRALRSSIQRSTLKKSILLYSQHCTTDLHTKTARNMSGEPPAKKIKTGDEKKTKVEVLRHKIHVMLKGSLRSLTILILKEGWVPMTTPILLLI